jgi:hypothetical protein
VAISHTDGRLQRPRRGSLFRRSWSKVLSKMSVGGYSLYSPELGQAQGCHVVCFFSIPLQPGEIMSLQLAATRY